ncbi:MAG: hypothetical protein JWP81_4729 [Ferruginibacter sp.]|nr:hypothetical protein [Ferruginibacter sp.]
MLPKAKSYRVALAHLGEIAPNLLELLLPEMDALAGYIKKCESDNKEFTWRRPIALQVMEREHAKMIRLKKYLLYVINYSASHTKKKVKKVPAVLPVGDGLERITYAPAVPSIGRGHRSNKGYQLASGNYQNAQAKKAARAKKGLS